MMKNINLILCVMILFCAGCSSTTAFRSYTGMMQPVLDEVESGRDGEVGLPFEKLVQSKDRVLYLMERGRLAQIQGRFDDSLEDFTAAIQAIKEFEQKAVVSASGALAQGSAVIVNDNTLPYRGDGYEKVMLHHLQAMNYLMTGNLSDAGVEARRANIEQDEILKVHQNEIQKAQQLAQQNNVSSGMPDSVAERFSKMESSVGNVKDSFQNAGSFYLSGIIYEMLKLPNDAYIDYKKALEINSQNKFLQADVVRLAKQLNFSADVARFKNEYPEIFERQSRIDETSEVVIFYDDDFVIQKQAVEIPLPVPVNDDIGFMAVAFPIYESYGFGGLPLVISDAQKNWGQTQEICDINALAIKSLQEKMPALVVRLLIRATAKYTLMYKSREQFGFLGALGASIYNVASERADVRSWLTLPANTQIFRLPAKAGNYDLRLTQTQTNVSAVVNFSLEKDQKIVLWVIRVGRQMKVYQVIF